MLVLQNDIMEMIRCHAQTAYPKECCGILLGRRLNGERIGYKAVQTGNIAGERRDTTHFLISPLEIAKAELLAEKESLEIIGFYHSHPDYQAIASNTDVDYMIAKYSYPIISVKNGMCAEVKSFEKINQTDTDAKEEKIMIKER